MNFDENKDHNGIPSPFWPSHDNGIPKVQVHEHSFRDLKRSEYVANMPHADLVGTVLMLANVAEKNAQEVDAKTRTMEREAQTLRNNVEAHTRRQTRRVVAIAMGIAAVVVYIAVINTLVLFTR